MPGDEEIARRLRSAAVPVIIAVNKTDDKRARGRAVEFYQLGFEPVVEIAAEHGDGVDELLDEIVARLPARRRRGPSSRTKPAVAIVGRPNVGKSSLVNRLLREERVIVSEMPGTTRDTVDVVLNWQKRTFRILDTAGMRRPGRVARGGAGRGGERRPRAARDREGGRRRARHRRDRRRHRSGGDDCRRGREGRLRHRHRRQQVGPDEGAGQDFSKKFDDKLRHIKFLDYAPILHLSALTGERTPKLLEVIDRVADARKQRVPTAELNRFWRR